MNGVNKVILLGYLGKNPEIRYLEGGMPVAKFTLATSETFMREGNRIEQTEWHNIVVWRGLAEIAERYLVKGKLVYIEGKIRTRTWEDKEGNKKYATEIVADILNMIGAKEETSLSELEKEPEMETRMEKDSSLVKDTSPKGYSIKAEASNQGQGTSPKDETYGGLPF